MRLFIAIDLEKSIKDQVLSIQKRLEQPGIKLVEPENLHFCLKFLGDTNESKIPEIKEVIDKVSEQFEEFTLSIDEVGTFPSETYINVIWAGVKEGKNILVTIANTLNFELDKIGFDLDLREFIPHLTLARVKKVNSKDQLLSVLAKIKTFKFGSMTVKSIKLIKSELTPEGPVYETIYESKIREKR